MGSASWQRSGSLNGWQDFGHEDTAVTRNDRMRARSPVPPASEPQLPAQGAHCRRHRADTLGTVDSRDSVDVRLWHFSDVPGQPDDVRSRGKTGSGLPTAKVTRLTQMRHEQHEFAATRSLFGNDVLECELGPSGVAVSPPRPGSEFADSKESE
jgi:hypothetical protein